MTPKRGTFVTLDGPGAVGKSTALGLLAGRIRARGTDVLATAEPSSSSLGAFTRAHANELAGRALACLVAANRWEHIDTEIQPSLDAGKTVLCDRYLASTLVLQRLDGVPESYLLAVSNGILLPDLAVILTAEPRAITSRLAARGARHRFHAPTREVQLYAEAAETLRGMGVHVLEVDTTHLQPAAVADRITHALPHHTGSLTLHSLPDDPR
ncbi:dTMP kinase [Streptomyces hygroscopicus]|uniref:dTMP kinase n=1 Tax=Streptomyces hygroscopicus TaxID=1912 RepID=UPI003682E8FD